MESQCRRPPVVRDGGEYYPQQPPPRSEQRTRKRFSRRKMQSPLHLTTTLLAFLLSTLSQILAYQPSLLQKSKNFLLSQDELMMQRQESLWTMEAPSMFVHQSQFSIPTSKLLQTSSPTSAARTNKKAIDIKELSSSSVSSMMFHAQRNRGKLGFQIVDRTETDDATTTTTTTTTATDILAFSETRRETRLNAHVPFFESNGTPVSNVDPSSWNVPEPLSLDANAVFGRRTRRSKPMVLAQQRPKAVSMNDDEGQEVIAPPPANGGCIPWVPNDEEIESLTVVQLKDELGARGLKKSGNKVELQDRLKVWTVDQQRRQRLLARDAAHSGDLSSLSLQQAYSSSTTDSTFERELQSWDIESSSLLKESDKMQQAEEREDSKGLEANSLAEWVRTVDLEPLLHRREEIHREKMQGKPKKKPQQPATTVLPSDYLSVLKKVFDKPSSPYSNREVKQMYMAAKHADQAGDRELAKRLLLELKKATPNDARIYRRLARMENEDGNIAAARAVLQEGLELHPSNAFLWHGLGQLEGSIGNSAAQKKHLTKAIEEDPSLPHSYHALGTLEHTQGRVANAMKTLKKGIEYCPTNHRLHHALGDLYRDAKMLDMASSSYHKALKHGPPVSYGFAYIALAYVAYEQRQVDECRQWLHKAVQVNNGRNANGWVALAQFEESEGNIDAARSACIASIAKYERGLLERRHNVKFRRSESYDRAFLEDPVALKTRILKSVPSYRSGDRFFNVYRNWARLEERYGTIETVEEVYERALVAFPREWKLALDWAQYYETLDILDRARLQFANACNKAGKRHADPYRFFAEFEMSHGNYAEARKILYSGAMALSQGSENRERTENQHGLAELFHTWAVCEWHLGNLSHADILFQHSLDLASSSEGSKLRSFVLYSMARLEHFRGENRKAQHYIGLCLKENLMPGGNSKVWDLWAAVAHEMGYDKLAQQCQEHAEHARLQEAETDGDPSGLSRLLDVAGSSLKRNGPDMKQLVRRDPWHHKIFGTSGSQVSHNYGRVKLPSDKRLAHGRSN